jgi:hypothetical protein
VKDIIKKILREEKKKLFIPRNIDERSVEFGKMVKDASNNFLTKNNIKSLKYIIKVDELWEYDLDYADIDNAIRYEGKIIISNGEDLDNKILYYNVKYPDLIDYSHTISSYLNYLISQHNPKDLVINDLEIEVDSVVDSIKMDFIFTHQNRKVVSFSKTI